MQRDGSIMSVTDEVTVRTARHRYMRRELDRLSGEIVRRQDETDASLELYARRERLYVLFCRRVGWWRDSLEFARWFVSRTSRETE